ncbi:uncharacterized protein APUU_31331A [Aspergillus puulaauensis]|uniref:Uncharacterized protein n=1 Tax=Aspergillus puulaauensis TaxID=1220207 RepID=A0A7R7XKG1_9EURO|nr:uncharacterized protein APUU_31331A [Aspergillus puulaauensis]BCS23106.1 hypothetical protein APUU_31331A [Aspergillus puulaauensis]
MPGNVLSSWFGMRPSAWVLPQNHNDSDHVHDVDDDHQHQKHDPNSDWNDNYQCAVLRSMSNVVSRAR